MSDSDVAVIGMTGRFPGASTLERFWDNLCRGVESIRFSSEAAPGDPHHVKAAAVLEGMEQFDAAFFGFTPREAELMDPQHRVFLECCWEALERAGYAPDACPGAVGVFAGATTNTYLLYNLVSNRALLEALDQVQVDVGNGADFLSTRVSYKLNLRGPSYTVQSACSTSLVAVHVACQSLLNEECDLALAGGVSIHVKHPEGYRYLPGGITSPDGHCRAFDARAEGTIFGSGAGVVVLKRLKEALDDGDFIHAVIKGSAVNNDGSAKVGYTAPSVEGQAAVISEALAAAGVSPDTISYVESHGTGTKMGDPIEVRALNKAFRRRSKTGERCLIGSLKTNIGHLAGAAGVASFVKAVLSVEKGRIPPSLHFENASPEIDFAGGPFQVNAGLAEWPRSPRRAGVSSFGVGGTNAHVVLEEAPAREPPGPSRAAQLLVLSAKTPAALDAATENLARHLQANPELHLADVAHTLQVGRRAMPCRRAVLCRDGEGAARALEARDARLTWTELSAVPDRPVAFLFPGQGTQHVGMAGELHLQEPVFREHLDACAQLLQPHLGVDLRRVLYPEAGREEEASRQLEQTAFTQPALFAVEYALAQLWMSWGVRPQAMVGHSIGEYVAACLAGVFELRDALALVAARGKLMQSLPAGGMLAVLLPEEQLLPHLGRGLSLAAVNGPQLTVASGPPADIEALEARLLAQGVGTHRLHTSHAFHSAMMEPILPELTERVRQVKLSPPKLPYVSNVTGTWIEAAQATDPGYWATHLRQAVRFAAGLRTLLQKPQQILLEVGPGQTLGKLAKPLLGPSGAVALASTRSAREQASDVEVLLGALGRLWASGAAVDWNGFHAGERRRRVPLPTYPFERQRYWVEPRALSEAPSPAAVAEKKPDVADWFYVPSWRSAPRPALVQGPAISEGAWLLFADASGVAGALAARLSREGRPVVQVVPGNDFRRREDGVYELDPGRREHYTALFEALQAQGQGPGGVVHLWNMAPPSGALDAGFHQLISFAGALVEHEPGRPLRCWVVTSGAAKVESGDTVSPERAMLLAPCQVLPQEHPHVSCSLVDVGLSGAGASTLAEQLFAELHARTPEPIVGYRGRQRWTHRLEPLRLEASTPPVRALRDGGAYLITDGLAGVGWVVAGELARAHRARLALLEPAGFPPEDEWARWLATHGPEDAVSRKIRNAQALAAAGAEVLVLGADLGDEAQVRRAVEQATARFGRMDGVIHAAGGLQGASFQPLVETTPDACARHFAPQVHGVLALERALAAQPPEFCLLLSSLSSVLGGVGQVAYVAASHFMDAFAEQRGDSGPLAWLCVDWDAWKLEDGPSMEAISPELARLAISPAEGMEATRRLVTQVAAGRVVVSTCALDARRRRSAGSGPRAEAARPTHARPPTAAPYVEPGTELERKIARVYQYLLGFEPVGLDDNFFDLGGSSLMAVNASAQLKQALQADVPVATLYQRPTVRSLSELLLQDGDEVTRQRADKLVQRREELGRRNQWLQKRRRS